MLTSRTVPRKPQARNQRSGKGEREKTKKKKNCMSSTESRKDTSTLTLAQEAGIISGLFFHLLSEPSARETLLLPASHSEPCAPSDVHRSRPSGSPSHSPSYGRSDETEGNSSFSSLPVEVHQGRSFLVSSCCNRKRTNRSTSS